MQAQNDFFLFGLVTQYNKLCCINNVHLITRFYGINTVNLTMEMNLWFIGYTDMYTYQGLYSLEISFALNHCVCALEKFNCKVTHI